ncbi:protein real-time isoform X1 [Schistocerca nitens]|uniref:protein real-time isoform X1 n=1 Tax=Schistocerca nitens TaxID=7011 RepID=UPI0021199009|nr:protein real-time isoform X1 [Schistocerca nitens]
MVQKYQSPVRVYKYPFELVMAAYERRFPTCPLIPVFVGCEVTSEFTSPDGAVSLKERRCKLNVEAPYLIKKIIGVDHVYFIQKNNLDRRNRTLHIEAYNESFASRVVVVEKCRYFVHPENPDWTCFDQSATLDIKSFFGFENSMEKLAMKQYSQNIAKGKEIIEHFINELKKEGVVYIPPWQEPEDGSAAAEEERAQTANDSSGDFDLGASASNISAALPSPPMLSPSAESQFELDTDYIQRYLGELSLIQESSLVQLRKWVADLQKGKVPSDSTLLRFLRARDFNVEKAREMLSQSLIWRKKHQVDRILSEYQIPQVVQDYFPGGWHHMDKDGRPLYLLRLGQMDVKGLFKSVGEEGLLKLTLHVCEEGLQLMEEATRTQGKPVSTWSLLVDLEGLNMRHLWRPGVKALLRIIEIVEANYPETMGRVLIIRAPRVFPILWTIVGTFIDENTRSKFLFYGGNDYQGAEGLENWIPEQYIPDFLGGSCRPNFPVEPGSVPFSMFDTWEDSTYFTTMVQEGGLVPKSLYMSEEELGKEGCPLTEDSIYHCVTLGRGQVHEVLISNDDPGSVITWDFDVMRQDVMFSVYRTRVPVMLHTATGPLQTIQQMNPLATDPEHRSVIEKSWREGQDYFRVEAPVVCHDGESIQGSHVTSHVGTYILQWKFHCNHPLDIIDSITAHKAQVMYYYEQLRSSDYRGSMSSLQSAHSGISGKSTRSGTSSCPSR